MGGYVTQAERLARLTVAHITAQGIPGLTATVALARSPAVLRKGTITRPETVTATVRAGYAVTGATLDFGWRTHGACKRHRAPGTKPVGGYVTWSGHGYAYPLRSVNRLVTVLGTWPHRS